MCARSLAERRRRVIRLLCKDFWNGRRSIFPEEMYWFPISFIQEGETPTTCESEVLSVGGIDNVDISAVQEFDYVALGHLHGAQRVGQEKIRYCGTLLKYSVSEASQKKTLHVVELKEKGSEPEIQKLPLHPLRDVRKLRGTLEEILEAEDGTGSEDYVSVTLTDEVDPYKPKEQLERKFHHILEVRMDNERTRQKLEFSEEQIRIGTPFETFCDFYKEMQGQEMSEQEQKILREILSEMKGKTYETGEIDDVRIRILCGRPGDRFYKDSQRIISDHRRYGCRKNNHL